MAIADPADFPDATSIASARFGLKSNSLANVSPFTQAMQVVQGVGGLWLCEVQLKPLLPDDGAWKWEAFLQSREGPFRKINAYNPARRTPLGAGGGTPRVNGGSQAGNALITDGWPNSTLVLKAGDFFTVGATKRLYRVVNDATTNGSGQVTLDIVPMLRESPADNDLLTVSSWTIPMRLVGNEAMADIQEALFTGLNFSMVEAL